MHGLVLRGQAIDMRAYEVAGVEQIVAELQPLTLANLREGRDLLGAILDSCQQLPPADRIGGDEPSPMWSSYLPFERAIDATMARLGSHQAVDEIAFIAQIELRQRQERLERVRAAQGTVALLTECDSSLRRIRKALNAVDAAIAKVEDVAPLLDFTSELQTSLAVRRAYAKLRARIVAGGEPAPDQLRARFRGAGTQIAVLVGRPVYPEMRVHDRLLLRELQQRMLDWLRGGPGMTPAAGLRIWQDLTGCMDMFALVNRRQELVEHDGAIVRALAARVDEPTLVDDLHDQLLALEGLDPELDRVLAGEGLDAAALRPIMTRLAAQFRSGGDASSPPAGGTPW